MPSACRTLSLQLVDILWFPSVGFLYAHKGKGSFLGRHYLSSDTLSVNCSICIVFSQSTQQRCLNFY